MIPLLPLLAFVLVICIVCWVVNTLLNAFSVPQPLASVVWVVVVLVCLGYFLNGTGIGEQIARFLR